MLVTLQTSLVILNIRRDLKITVFFPIVKDRIPIMVNCRAGYPKPREPLGLEPKAPSQEKLIDQLGSDNLCVFFFKFFLYQIILDGAELCKTFMDGV